MGSGPQWLEPDKKVPFYWKCGFLLPTEVNVRICFCEGQRVEPNSFKKATHTHTHTHTKAVFKADHTFLMNSECLLPSLGWSLCLQMRFLKNAGISKNIIPLFPNKNVRITCTWEITLGSPWSKIGTFLRLSEVKGTRYAHIGPGGGQADTWIVSSCLFNFIGLDYHITLLLSRFSFWWTFVNFWPPSGHSLFLALLGDSFRKSLFLLSAVSWEALTPILHSRPELCLA